MLILQFLEGLVVSLLASIGVLQTPCISGGNSRHTCGVPGYYKSASFRRLSEGLALRRHLAVVGGSLVQWRFPCRLQSVSFRRQGFMDLFTGDTWRCPRLLGIGVFQTPV